MTSLPLRRNGAASRRWVAILRPIALMLALCHASHAEPYRPASDDVVLATVPRAIQQLKSAREAVAARSTDQDAALRLARHWLEAARREGDPRFFSYAQATLEPWMEDAAVRADTRVLMATALQGLHRFSEAHALLDRALRTEPQNAQAWLTKAALLQVQGEFSGARSACAPLLRLADASVALGCIAAAQSMSGHLDASFGSLSRMVDTSPHHDPATRSWLLGMLGEMAVRMNDPRTAERYFRTSIDTDTANSYARGELADLLLREARYDEVIHLLEQDAGQDAFLLRLAIAGQRMHSPAADRWVAAYDARYRAAQRDNDTLHLREIARYLLEVRGDTSAALDAARRNWKTQREPADIRIYWQASSADASARSSLKDWIARTSYQDALLEAPTEE